jgi:hypothetical protein
MRQRLMHDAFHELGAAFDLAEEHGPLNHRKTIVGDLLFGHMPIEASALARIDH